MHLRTHRPYVTLIHITSKLKRARCSRYWTTQKGGISSGGRVVFKTIFVTINIVDNSYLFSGYVYTVYEFKQNLVDNSYSFIYLQYITVSTTVFVSGVLLLMSVILDFFGSAPLH